MQTNNSIESSSRGRFSIPNNERVLQILFLRLLCLMFFLNFDDDSLLTEG